MEDNMEKENIFLKLVNTEKVSGKMANVQDGLTRTIQTFLELKIINSIHFVIRPYSYFI